MLTHCAVACLNAIMADLVIYLRNLHDEWVRSGMYHSAECGCECRVMNAINALEDFAI